MLSHIERVNAAISDLKQGKMIILTDHPDRENEGDLVVAAETLTVEQMNFMIRHGGGIICLPMSKEILENLQLPLMVAPNDNSSTYGTPFNLSIDAKCGITTGVSAADRTTTVRVAIDPATKPDDLVKPGHMFPLQARPGGVLERQGHTEGATDLAALAGFKKAAVIGEIMNPDGSMAVGDDLTLFAKTHQLTMLSIDDLVAYRLLHENMIAEETTVFMPLAEYGEFQLTVMREKIHGHEHMLLSKPMVDVNAAPLVRIHSACTTGDLFGSQRCDCHAQLHYSLDRISKEGGMLIYLNQEGRGIGLFNKIKAYALQEKGFDTVDANKELGLPIDCRDYAFAANILRHRGVNHVRLLTNNPSKVHDLIKYGISNVERVAMPSFHNEFNRDYLNTKKAKLNHVINFDFTTLLAKVSQ